MNNQHDILRLLRNLIRIGTVSAVDLDNGLCRVETGGNLTVAGLAKFPRWAYPQLVGAFRRRAC